MTNWNRIKEINSINQTELMHNISESASWHNTYKSSAYIFAGNLSYDLNEGDLITVFSQFGEIVDCNLIRDKESGESKGFAFIAFENQKSTNLAVDNMNGANLLNRTLNVDHVRRYRKPKHFKKDKLKNNKYGDVEESDETYEERRNKIWDYRKYLNPDINIVSLQKEDEKYLNEKKQKEQMFEAKQSEIDKQIEIRKLKRQLIKMTDSKKKNDANNNIDEKFRRKDGNNHQNKAKLVVDGNEIRDAYGKVIDVERELEKRKRMEEIAKEEEYQRELEVIKAEKKQKRMAKKSKSQILNERLRKANKKMKKNKRKKPMNDDSNSRPHKKRKK